MDSKKRDRSPTSNVLVNADFADKSNKKRKKSFSGIELPDPEDSKDDFIQFNINSNIAQRLKDKNIHSLFDVQKKVYSYIHQGDSVIVASLTGTGKTLAFVLPVLQRIHDQHYYDNQTPCVLVMAPTRELSIQVGKEFSDLSSKDFRFKTAMIYGGVSMDDQIYKLKAGVDIIIGTPGRIMDMIERGHLKVSNIKIVILDEADKMLSMGFEEQIEDIFNKVNLNKTKKVQVCLFSATIEKWVRDVAKKIIPDKGEVYIDLVKDLANKTPKTITHLGVMCIKSEKTTTIADLILTYGGRNKATLIFVNTKKECNDLMISDKIKQEVQIIHGDINQAQREATLSAFRNGKLKCLVATDVASRGLDIPDVDLVIQSDPPKEIDTYIHRSGRTARAGRAGICITLYTRYNECLLERIEQKAKIKIKRIGAPQKKDIIQSSIRDIEINILKIDDSMIKLFNDSAKNLIEQFGAENVVSRLLAYASGHTDKMKSRSLLCGAEGFITYAIKFTTRFQHAGYVWGFFKRSLKEDIKSKIRGMRCFSSLDGCVFDFPEEDHEILEEVLYNDRLYGKNFTLEVIDTLPELQELNNDSNRFNNTTQSVKPNYNKTYEKKRYIRKEGKIDIFVGNLPYNITDEDFRNWLIEKGINIDFDARLAVDKETGNQRGFGFVSVYNKEDLAEILKLNGKEYNRRKLVINESKNNK